MALVLDRFEKSQFTVDFFFFNDTATTEIYTLSLHDALPICGQPTGQAPHTLGKARPAPGRTPRKTRHPACSRGRRTHSGALRRRPSPPGPAVQAAARPPAKQPGQQGQAPAPGPGSAAY